MEHRRAVAAGLSAVAIAGAGTLTAWTLVNAPQPEKIPAQYEPKAAEVKRPTVVRTQVVDVEVPVLSLIHI